jgi:hypothetical protein
MRLVFLIVFCVVSAGCVKTDLEPLPTVTRVELSDSMYGSTKDLSEAKNVSAIVDFIDGQRLGWTREFLVGSGPPSPFVRANLYDGNRHIGYFAVASGVSPGGHAAFEVQYGKIRAHKRVAKTEANRFLDLIGMGGELE